MEKVTFTSGQIIEVALAVNYLVSQKTKSGSDRHLVVSGEDLIGRQKYSLHYDGFIGPVTYTGYDCEVEGGRRAKVYQIGSDMWMRFKDRSAQKIDKASEMYRMAVRQLEINQL
jgi:hypothetical protein